MGIISPPVLLDNEHNVLLFDCNHDSLNGWLKKRALKNQDNGASRTFVICKNKQVIGYYALATGSIERLNAPKAIARNMPSPIPIIILGRLAVDIQHQNHKLGSGLLKDAMLRTLLLSQNAGVRALLVHAISEQAKQFYMSYGFLESPMESMTLLLSIQHIKSHC